MSLLGAVWLYHLLGWPGGDLFVLVRVGCTAVVSDGDGANYKFCTNHYEWVGREDSYWYQQLEWAVTRRPAATKFYRSYQETCLSYNRHLCYEAFPCFGTRPLYQASRK